MQIKKLTLSNYMSFNKASIELQPNQLYIIYGQNKDNGGSNGIGKSALLEAIPLCVYGKSIRSGISSIKDFIKKDKKQMELEIETYNGIYIKRIRTSTKEETIFKVNDKEIDIRLKTDVNNEIEKYIITFEKFRYLNYFNQTTLNFFSLTPKQRFAVLEEIFQLQKLSEMHDQYKEKQKITDIDLTQYKKEKEFLEIQIKNNIETYNNLKNSIDNEIENEIYQYIEDVKIKSIKEVEYLQQSLKNKQKDIESYLSSYLDIVSKLDDIENIQHIKDKLIQYNTLLNQIEELQSKPKICPVCKRPFNNDTDIHIEDLIKEKTNNEFDNIVDIQNKIKELELVLNKYQIIDNLKWKLNTEIKNYASMISNFLDKLKTTDFYLNEDSQNKLLNQIVDCNNLISNLLNLDIINKKDITIFNIEKIKIFFDSLKNVFDKKIENLKQYKRKTKIESLQNLKKSIEKNKERVIELDNEIQKLSYMKGIYDILVKELSGDFRSYIYNQYIENLSKLMNRHIKYLYPSFDISLQIKNEGKDKGIDLVINEKGIIKSYGNLSSGEKRICDLSFVISLSHFSSDILILDEALTTLSYEIKIRVIDLLRNLGKQVFIVEHDKSVIDELCYMYDDIKLINIVKENNISYIQ